MALPLIGTDLFCGAGGTSTAFMEAARLLGYEPQLTVVNHDIASIDTHKLNHPTARHFRTGVDDIRPLSLFKRQKPHILLASPECTNHSKAKGGMPRNDQSRSTANCVVNWARDLRPELILVENVSEFMDWGPIRQKRGEDGQLLWLYSDKDKSVPCSRLPRRKSDETELRWANRLKRMGYRPFLEPDPAGKGKFFKSWIRKLQRLGYTIDVKRHVAGKYGDPTSRERLFIQCQGPGRKIVWPDQTHVPQKQFDALPTPTPSWPKRQKVARDCIDWSIKGRWLDEMPEKKQHDGLPLSPNTLERIQIGLWRSVKAAGGKLLQPYIVSWDHQSGTGVRGADQPLSSVTSKARHAVVDPFLVELRGTDMSNLAASYRALEDLVGTVSTSGAHHALVEPYLIQVAHGAGDSPSGHERRVKSLDSQMPTICGSRGDMALIEAMLIPQQSCGIARPMDALAPTVSTSGAIGFVEAFLLPQHSSNNPRSVSSQVSTVTTTSRGIGFLEPYLVKYYGTATTASINDQLGTVTTKERFALVEPEAIEIEWRKNKNRRVGTPKLRMPIIWIDDRLYAVRFRWRMLTPRELATAQGFRKDYIFPGNKSVTVKQVGNAVPRNLARALILAAWSQQSDITPFLDRRELAA